MAAIITYQKKVVIAGYIVGGPLGGLVWHHLQYAIALHRMGFDILFVEHSNNYPSCYNPITNEVSTDPTYGIEFLDTVFNNYGLTGKWAYYSLHTDCWYGKTKSAVEKFAQATDLFINLSGIHPVDEIFHSISAKVFIDTDPVFTQIRHLTDPVAMEIASRHTHFYTYGENFGKGKCTIPDDGLSWLPTRQPVIKSLWDNKVAPDSNGKWTTIMQWDSYASREYNGQKYGMKSATFDPYFNLPADSIEKFELAIGSATAPKQQLLNAGWALRNPVEVTLTPERYQDYIRSSKGEWSVAKQGYVISGSGWFSERTTAYLASARPAIVQDTGFSSFLSTGRGLFAFTSPESSLNAIESINTNYRAHCKWAEEIVSDYFDYAKVISKILDGL